MRGVRKALQASGLAFLVGPLCMAVQAQDYVDVEAERAAQRSGDATGSPYNSPAAPASGATSYGLNSAPAGPAMVNAPASAHGGGECLRHRADQEGLGEAIRGPRGNYALTFPSLIGVAVVARM